MDNTTINTNQLTYFETPALPRLRKDDSELPEVAPASILERFVQQDEASIPLSQVLPQGEAAGRAETQTGQQAADELPETFPDTILQRFIDRTEPGGSLTQPGEAAYPHEIYTEAQLAAMKDFDPIRYYASLPESEKQKPEVLQKLHRVYDLQTQEPITAGQAAKKAVVGTAEAVAGLPGMVWNMVKSVAKSGIAYSKAMTGVWEKVNEKYPALGALWGVASPILPLLSRYEFGGRTAEEKIAHGQREALEGISGVLAELGELEDMLQRAGTFVSRGLHLTKPRSQMTEQEKLQDFLHRVANREAILSLERGELAIGEKRYTPEALEKIGLAGAFREAKETVREAGLELRPEEIREFKEGGMASWLAFSGAFKGIHAGKQAVKSMARQAAERAVLSKVPEAAAARTAKAAQEALAKAQAEATLAGELAESAQRGAFETLERRAAELAAKGIEMPPQLTAAEQAAVNKAFETFTAAQNALKAAEQRAATAAVSAETVGELYSQLKSLRSAIEKLSPEARAKGNLGQLAALEGELKEVTDLLKSSIEGKAVLAADAASSLLSRAGSVLGRAGEVLAEAPVRVAGWGLERVGRAVETVGTLARRISSPHWIPASVFAGTLFTGGHPAALVATLTAPLVAKKVTQFGGFLRRVGARLSADSPSIWAERLIEFNRALGNAFAAGVEQGLPLDMALAIASSTTPQEFEQAPMMGTAIAMGHRALRSVGLGTISREINRVRRAVDTVPDHPGYGTNPTLDQLHRQAVSTLEPRQRNIINFLRHYIGDQIGTEIYVLPEREYTSAIRQVYEQHGVPVTERQIDLIARSEGYFSADMRDANGNVKRFVFVNQARAIPHELSHAFERILPAGLVAKLDMAILANLSPDQVARFADEYVKRFGEQRRPGETWQDMIRRVFDLPASQPAEAFIAREIRAENLAKLLDTQATAILEPDIFNRTAFFLGSILERLGVPITEQTSTIGAPLTVKGMQVARKAMKKALSDKALLDAIKKARQAAQQVTPQAVQPTAPAPATTTVPPQAPAGAAPPRTVTRAPHETVEAAERRRAAVQQAEAIVRDKPAPPPDKTVPNPQRPIEVLQAVNSAIERGVPVRVVYRSAPGAREAELPSTVPVSSEIPRSEVIEAARSLPEHLRPAIERLITPYKIEATKGGVVQIYGFSPQVFAANARRWAKTLAQAGRLDLFPYEVTKEGEITPNGWQALLNDLQIYLANQAAGYTGSGKPLKVPPMAGYEAPPVTGKPVPLDQAKADFINFLMGFQYPETGRVETAAKLPLAAAGAEVSKATEPGRVSIPDIAPKYGYSKTGKPLEKSLERAEALGIAGQPVPETNPYRAEARKAVGPKAIKLFPTIQRLNLEHIAYVEAAPEQPAMRSNVLTVEAGFKPAAKVEEIQRLVEASNDDWKAAVSEFKGRYGSGLTGHAFELGASLRTPEEAMALRQAYNTFSDLSKASLANKDFGTAMVYSTRAQWAREAWEAATGTRVDGTEGPVSAVEGIRKYYDPNYEPPVKVPGKATLPTPEAAPPAETALKPKAAEEKPAEEKPDYRIPQPTTYAFQSGMFIDPKGQYHYLGNTLHEEWFYQNAPKYGVNVEKAIMEGADLRPLALQKGFARMTLLRRYGDMHIEMRARDWSRHKDTIGEFLEANADQLNRVQIYLYDDKVASVIDQNALDLRTAPKEGRRGAIYEFLDSLSPRGAFKPKVAEEAKPAEEPTEAIPVRRRGAEEPLAYSLKPKKKEKAPYRFTFERAETDQTGAIIDPKGDFHFTEGPHIDWLRRNAEKYGLGKAIEEAEGDPRIAAVQRGFARVTYLRHSGDLHIELRARDLSKYRDLIERILEDNADQTNNAEIYLFNDKVNRVIDEGSVNLYVTPPERRRAAIYEMLDSLSPRGAFKPKAAEEAPEKLPVREKKEAEAEPTPRRPIPVRKRGEMETFRQAITPILESLKEGKIEGATITAEGREYTPPKDAKLDVVTVASKNFAPEELTPEAVRDYLDQYRELLSSPGVKPGFYRLSDGRISLDINVLVPQKYRENTIDFARRNNQESIFDFVKFESVPTGGTGETRLKDPARMADAIDYLLRGERVPDEIFGPVQAAQRTFGFGEPTEVTGGEWNRRRIVEATVEELQRGPWPEIENIPKGTPTPYKFTEMEPVKGKPREEQIRITADHLDKLYQEELKNREKVMEYAKWYDVATEILSKLFGEDLRLFAELIAVFSPQNRVKTNVKQALEAYADWKLGRYNRALKQMAKLEALIESGKLKKMYDPAGANGYTEAQMVGMYIRDHAPDLAHVRKAKEWPALLVMLRRWAHREGALKTHAFAGALAGDPLAVVIDQWVARAINRALRSPYEKNWRRIPENETGIDDTQYRFAAEVINELAQRWNMTPRQAQAAVWAMEKEYWKNKNWTYVGVEDVLSALREFGVSTPKDIAEFVKKRKKEPFVLEVRKKEQERQAKLYKAGEEEFELEYE